MSEWEPIQATATSVASSCLNCPPRPTRLPFNRNPHPGFGILSLRRNGEEVDSHVRFEGGLAAITRWDQRANDDPDHEWVIEVEGPMTGVRYRRTSRREWHAVERSWGFA